MILHSSSIQKDYPFHVLPQACIDLISDLYRGFPNMSCTRSVVFKGVVNLVLSV
jgi:hypothetical protein